MKKNETPFWRNVEGKIKISHSQIIEFLNQNGYRKLKVNKSKHILTRKEGKFLVESDENEITDFVFNYIKRQGNPDLFEVFVQGIGNYLSAKKLSLLDSIDLIDDKDTINSSRFYFKNTIVEVRKNEVKLLGYEELNKTIWKDRLLNGTFEKVDNIDEGQFYRFCYNISNKDDQRFNFLCSILGYLMHRNKENGEQIAITMYDENLDFGTAEGRTGKTLLSQALSQVRDVLKINGKEYKTNTNFKNQRVNLSTDILVYDDLNKNVSLENFYSQITTGIEIEQKRRDSYYLEFKDSPKIIITSNYYIKGPGGSSDRARRVELYLANYYSDTFTPIDDFGNRFFSHEWNTREWNLFYGFLIHCIQMYLKNGLIKYNLKDNFKNSLASRTSKEFVDFAENNIEVNLTYNKRELQSFFSEYANITGKITPHRFYKWCSAWSDENGLVLDSKSQGGKALIRFEKKVDKLVKKT